MPISNFELINAYINALIKKRFGVEDCSLNRHIINLSEIEKVVLSRGLDFCIPSQNVNKVEVLAEFEVVFTATSSCSFLHGPVCVVQIQLIGTLSHGVTLTTRPLRL